MKQVGQWVRMNRRNLGIGLAALGLVMIVIGIAGLGGSEKTETFAATPATPVTSAAPTTTTPATTNTTSEAPPPTTTATTTTSTTTTSTTTTTAAPAPSIEEFIVAYAAATASGDAAFLYDSLMPGLRDVFGEELCRGWVDREIVIISDYQLTGEVTGPIARTLNVGETTLNVDQYYEAPVKFTFQGESFDTVATFVVEDGQVYWIGACR